MLNDLVMAGRRRGRVSQCAADAALTRRVGGGCCTDWRERPVLPGSRGRGVAAVESRTVHEDCTAQRRPAGGRTTAQTRGDEDEDSVRQTRHDTHTRRAHCRTSTGIALHCISLHYRVLCKSYQRFDSPGLDAFTCEGTLVCTDGPRYEGGRCGADTRAGERKRSDVMETLRN